MLVDDDGIALMDIKNHDNTIYAMTNATTFSNEVLCFRIDFILAKCSSVMGRTLNEFKHFHLLVNELEHPIFGFNRMDIERQI